MAWKKGASKEAYSNPYFRVTEDEVTSDAGHTFTWYVVRSPAFAMTVPWDGERFVLVRQYRHPAKMYSWEFPAGAADKGSVKDSAGRELEEETGLVAGSIKPLGKFYASIGRSDQVGQLFLATKLSEGAQKLDLAEEGMKVKRVTYAELVSMIKTGEIVEGATIAALGLLHASGWVKKQGL